MNDSMLMHFIVPLVVVMVAAVVLLGYRDRHRVQLPDQLAALLAMLGGVAFGMLWELLEFILDWVFSTDLQPSNTDTMTDLLAVDVASVVGAVLATWLYCRWLSPSHRHAAGHVGGWVFVRPSRVLDKHGLVMTALFVALTLLALVVLWFSGRPVPGFPIG